MDFRLLLFLNKPLEFAKKPSRMGRKAKGYPVIALFYGKCYRIASREIFPAGRIFASLPSSTVVRLPPGLLLLTS